MVPRSATYIRVKKLKPICRQSWRVCVTRSRMNVGYKKFQNDLRRQNKTVMGLVLTTFCFEDRCSTIEPHDRYTQQNQCTIIIHIHHIPYLIFIQQTHLKSNLQLPLSSSFNILIYKKYHIVILNQQNHTF